MEIMTEWNEFSVHINREATEAVSNALIELGSAGVSVSDRHDFLNLPEYGFDTLWALDEDKFPEKGVTIKGYFHGGQSLNDLEANITQKIEELKGYGLDITTYSIERDEVKQENWAEAWKKYYHPVPITRYMTIVPQWEDYTPKYKDENIITLDPGLAFGTGTHPTTQLCLQILEMIIRGEETVVDVGTGSGVLSIASSYLGASTIYAYDLDDVAVTAAQSNVELNQRQANITIKPNDLLKGVDVEADVVVANILTEIILPLIPDAMRVLRPNGYFLSSGIIQEKKEQVIKKLENEGFIVEQVNQMKDWVAILARKPSEEEARDIKDGVYNA